MLAVYTCTFWRLQWNHVFLPSLILFSLCKKVKYSAEDKNFKINTHTVNKITLRESTQSRAHERTRSVSQDAEVSTSSHTEQTFQKWRQRGPSRQRRARTIPKRQGKASFHHRSAARPSSSAWCWVPLSCPPRGGCQAALPRLPSAVRAALSTAWHS